MSHDIMEYDILIVGGGPAGLAAAIRILQKAKNPLRVCLLEKGAQIGSHLMSGAVLDPRSLKTLFPDDWQQAPLDTAVTSDRFYYLTKNIAIRLPTPKPFKNGADHHIISLSELGRFLAERAQNLGCEIYTGFAATEILYNETGRVIGVATGDMGIDKAGQHKPQYQPGIHIHAKQTLFAEGCRGELSQKLMARFNLRQNADPQTYGLGVKEIWTVPAEKHRPGSVTHSIGWPLDPKTYGGSFIYHFSKQRVALGFVTGLDYQNPWLSPFEEMQRFKTHPAIRSLLQGGERIAFGARALNEGGWQSLPKCTFPGGMLLGDAAGVLNVARIKGIHMAIESGILAADACVENIEANHPELISYTEKFKASWAAQELYQVRNIRPGFRYGLWAGLLNAAFETYITQGHSPWTLSNHDDATCLKMASKMPKIDYPKPDNHLTFDRASSVYLTNTFHEENQPVHLKLKDPALAVTVNYALYASPETRYCPAGVYEIEQIEDKPHLKINAQNCIHCKTCDIKDPKQNILWTAPEGGGGPNYASM